MESHRGTVHITSDERDQSKDAKNMVRSEDLYVRKLNTH